MDDRELTTQDGSLEELERVIQRGLDTYIEVGLALLAIRDRQLYRERGYTAFDDYCRETWGWSRQRAYQLMDGAKVARALSTVVDSSLPAPVLPSNERQARALAPLLDQGAETVAGTWDELRQIHGEKVTAAAIKQVVNEKLGRPSPVPRPMPTNHWPEDEPDEDDQPIPHAVIDMALLPKELNSDQKAYFLLGKVLAVKAREPESVAAVALERNPARYSREQADLFEGFGEWLRRYVAALRRQASTPMRAVK